MNTQEFETLLSKGGPFKAYAELTGRPDWAAKLHLIPQHMHYSVVRWAAYGKSSNCGGFLQSILNNDLFEAAARGDVANQQALLQYVIFFTNYAPAGMRHYDNWVALVTEE